jgi:hypothetical protein
MEVRNMNAKLNIWIRDTNCEILKDRVHLHVYNCRGTPIAAYGFDGGHTEVAVPPGCYLVTAGGWGGNFYTDIAMAVVRCGDDACVNLIRNGFVHKTSGGIEPEAIRKQEPLKLIMDVCSARIAIPFVINAAKVGISREEIWKTLEVLFKAASLDKREVILGMQAEIKEIENDMEKNPIKNEPELKKIRESLKLLKDNIPASKV